jgi:hypothetical protein
LRGADERPQRDGAGGHECTHGATTRHS